MSSILDALEKLESRRTAGESPEPPRHRPRSALPLVVGGALVAFAAGIGLTAAWLRRTPAATAVPDAVPAPPPVAAATPAPAPPAVAPVAAPAMPAAAPRPLEQPWAEVVTPPEARRAPLDAAATANVPAAAVASLPAPDAAPAPPPAAPVRPAGAPAVRVSFLVYSSAPERRSVALAIDEGGLVTLQEGQQSGALSVVEILPDGVALAWQGQTFTVPAQR